jgi:hypothetical protein
VTKVIYKAVEWVEEDVTDQELWMEGIENILKDGVRSIRVSMRVEVVKDVFYYRVRWCSILSTSLVRDMV